MANKDDIVKLIETYSLSCRGIKPDNKIPALSKRRAESIIVKTYENGRTIPLCRYFQEGDCYAQSVFDPKYKGGKCTYSSIPMAREVDPREQALSVLVSALTANGTVSQTQMKGALTSLGEQVQQQEVPLLLSQKQAASLLGLSRYTIRRMTMEGKLHPVIVHETPRYRRSEIEGIANGSGQSGEVRQ